MDPLSVAANIIAVVDGATKIAEGLKRILSLRQAPQEVLQFINEISDFRAVITLAQESFRDIIDNESPPNILKLIDSMNQRLLSAIEILNELHEIVHNHVLIYQSNPKTGIRISKQEWLRRSKHMKQLFTSLRDTRSQISETLTIITATGVPQARAALRGVVLETQQLSTTMQNLETRTLSQLSYIQPRIQAIHSSLQEARSLLETRLESSSRPIGPTFQIQTSIHREGKCNSLCMCQCHQNFTFKSSDWVQNLVGTLLIGYHGAPLWYRKLCNERLCQREQTCLINLVYVFPVWFVRRAIFFRDRWTLTHGNLISIRTPRLVENSTVPAVQCACIGNLGGLQNLFAQGLASPFDVVCGELHSILHYAVTNRQTHICEFLLSQYADPYLQNRCSSSSLDFVWDQILWFPKKQSTAKLRRIFGRFLDADDNLQHRKFSVLHKIVLNLSSIPLVAQLQLSTADINARCVSGETPLFHAIRRDDSDAVQTLVNYGADISVISRESQTPMHAAARHSIKSLKILLKAAATISNSMNHSNSQLSENLMASCQTPSMESFLESRMRVPRYTPLQVGCRFDHTGEVVTLLHSYSANINSPGWPLLTAVQFNNHAVIKLLFSWGVNVNAKDHENMGLLHYSAAGDLKTLKILLAAGIKVEGFMDKDIFGRTPLQVFDEDRPMFCVEDAEMRDQCREIFLTILSRQGDPDSATEGGLLGTENSDVMPIEEELEEEVFYNFDEAIGTV